MKDKLLDRVRAMMLGMPDTLSAGVLVKRRGEIVAIGELCKKDALYKKTEKQRDDFYRPIRAVPIDKALLMCWVHFLDRMAGAPTPAHMHGVVVLCFPVLGDILKATKLK